MFCNMNTGSRVSVVCKGEKTTSAVKQQVLDQASVHHTFQQTVRALNRQLVPAVHSRNSIFAVFLQGPLQAQLLSMSKSLCPFFCFFFLISRGSLTRTEIMLSGQRSGALRTDASWPNPYTTYTGHSYRTTSDVAKKPFPTLAQKCC